MESEDDIVISGIAGRFPECENVEEFMNALLNGVDMVTVNERRYPPGIWGTPERSGTLPTIDKFDAGFFGIHPKLTNFMDPRQRILTEAVYESIIDAGYNPKELRGSKTGVYTGIAMMSNTDAYRKQKTDGYTNMGLNLALASNRISYTFDFKGPSYSIDTACSSAMSALSNAVRDLKNGQVENAVVNGAQIIFHPHETLEFDNLNMLDVEGKCRVFNTTRDGYARAETVATILLQKRRNCRRVYATILGAKANADGYKSEGITVPSSEAQFQLLKELYEESNVNPSDVGFVEAHGTGTTIGDKIECKAIVDMFFQENRDPLPIGAVKSNMGHSEMASGICSIVKVITAMERGIIPANLHINKLDVSLPGIEDNKLKVVTENLPWQGGIAGVNSFGWGGANVHAILQSNPKKKISSTKRLKHRLVQVSGRTPEAVNYFLDGIQANADDEEFLALVDEIHKTNIDGHNYRGYMVLGDTPKREIEKYTKDRPIWFIYTGMGCQWTTMGKDLLKIDAFRHTFERCAAALKPYNVDLIDIVTNPSPATFDSIANCFCAIGAMEIALTDVLFSFGIRPDGIAGHSLGEVCCAYADGLVTAEEAALLAFARGYSCQNVKLPPGQMAAVGLSKEAIQPMLPEEVYLACQNGKGSVTISGSQSPTQAFVEKLQSQGVFAKLVQSADIAFHTKYVMDAGLVLLDFVRKVLKDPKPRTTRWISSSVPSSKLELNWAKYNCPEYHYNNFCNTVLFDQVYQHIPENAIVIEVAPHGLLQAILKRELKPTNTYISIVNRSAEDNEEFLLSAVGKIFAAGGQPQLRSFYNNVTFPVSRGTKSLSPLVKWDHNISWFTPLYKHADAFGDVVTVNLLDEEYSHLRGHFIDGRILMPATGYLVLVWKVLAGMLLKDMNKLPIVIENVKFKRATVLPDGENVNFLVNIMTQSGNFEIFEGGSVTVTGRIWVPKNIEKEFVELDRPETQKNSYLLMSREDLYKECHLRRYMYADLFQGVKECDVYGVQGRLEWKEKFDSFLDTMLHLNIISENSRDLLLPTGLHRIVIDPQAHLKLVNKEKDIPITNHQELNILRSGGIEINGPEFSRAPRRHQIQSNPHLESYEFVPYEASPINSWDLTKSVNIALQIILQNCSGLIKRLKVCELVTENNTKPSVSVDMKEILDKLALADVDYVKLTGKALDEKFETIMLTENIATEIGSISLKDYLTEDGFILYVGAYPKISSQKLDIVFQSVTDTSGVYLLRPVNEFPQKYSVINVRQSDHGWLEKLKIFVESEEPRTVFLFSQGEELSGIVGLVKCLLAETSKISFRAVSIDQKTDIFSVDDEFYRDQLRKGLVYNVLRKNNWGTYVHQTIEEVEQREVANACVTVTTLGDLSTLSWMERPSIPFGSQENSENVNIFYSALNFKDVMVSTGKISFPVGNSPTAPDVQIGLEFSGVTDARKRVMGLIGYEGLSLQVPSDPWFMWEVPNTWTLQDAATVPCVYATCFYALIVRGNMMPGDSVLIHAGSGGVGIAAISISLSMGCEVFTTVGSKEKRDFLKKMFPKLKDKHIGNSRDNSFEKMVMRNTSGKGVNIVLNSLSGELFQASLRCLSRQGNFLEIGKVDFFNGTPIDARMFLKNCSFHGVLLDDLFEQHSKVKERIHSLLDEGIKNGVVKPLPRTVFNENELESAFRFLSSGKHKGKVLIEVRKEEPATVISPSRTIKAIPRLYFDPTKSYILIGGLGGFGLELADWMIRKGATKIVLNSRRHIWNGYQSFCMKKWSKYKSVEVKINTDDTVHLVGAEKLVKEAGKLGPVGGVFNMAVVLRDNLIQNQTKAQFEEVFKSKIISGQNMDTVTRKHCPKLDHFVVFSSIACGRGNIGQTNYAMANSALEKLCEKRRKEELPGLAVQWGPVADVGLLAKNDFLSLVLKYIRPQAITSCLNTLEQFMLKSTPVVSSVVLADNTSSAVKTTKSPAEAVAHILGLSDISLVDKSVTLGQLGLDSLMVAEIKQTLYRNFQLDFSPEEIIDLTFNLLLALDTDADSPNENGARPNSNENVEAFKSLNYLVAKETMITLQQPENSQKIIFVIHSIEGHIDHLKPLASKLKATVYGIQCTKDSSFQNMQELASLYIKEMKRKLPNGPYCICGYSFGSAVALEMALQLEKAGETAELILIDGSPFYVKKFLGDGFIKHQQSVERSQMAILGTFAVSFPEVEPKEVDETLKTWTDLPSMLNGLGSLISKNTGISPDEVAVSGEKLIWRCYAGLHYEPEGKVKGKILLIRAVDNPYKLTEDYDLIKVSQNAVKIIKLNGNHRTILLGDRLTDVANIINDTLSLT